MSTCNLLQIKKNKKAIIQKDTCTCIIYHMYLHKCILREKGTFTKFLNILRDYFKALSSMLK